MNKEQKRLLILVVEREIKILNNHKELKENYEDILRELGK